MKIGLEGSEVRDEIFTQICKEMDATPDSYVFVSLLLSFSLSFSLFSSTNWEYRQGKIRGWELMEFSLCTFPPTKEMEKQLLERFNLRILLFFIFISILSLFLSSSLFVCLFV